MRVFIFSSNSQSRKSTSMLTKMLDYKLKKFFPYLNFSPFTANEINKLYYSNSNDLFIYMKKGIAVSAWPKNSSQIKSWIWKTWHPIIQSVLSSVLTTSALWCHTKTDGNQWFSGKWSKEMHLQSISKNKTITGCVSECQLQWNITTNICFYVRSLRNICSIKNP